MTPTEMAFEYAIKNEKRIRSLLLKSARGDVSLAEEMFSEVALERLPRLFELYDGERPVDNYMLNNIRWYAFKYANRRVCSELQETGYKVKDSHLDALDQLSELDRYLIEASVLYGMTHGEIAADLQWPTHHVARAVKEAKAKLRECYDENRDWVLVKRVLRILCS